MLVVVEDVYVVFVWVYEYVFDEFGVFFGWVVVGGDSVGGNLLVVVC